MDGAREFDEAARSVELRLAELRRLLVGLDTLTDDQQARLAALLGPLESLGASVLELRNDILNAPEIPPSFVERGYESLPAGFTPSEWSTETYVTPVTPAWGQQFLPKPGGEITVDSLFEERETPPEILLPLDADLGGLFLELQPVYESQPTLLTGRDASGDWCVIIDDRPERAPVLIVFPTEAERGAWLGRVWASTLGQSRSCPRLPRRPSVLPAPSPTLSKTRETRRPCSKNEEPESISSPTWESTTSKGSFWNAAGLRSVLYMTMAMTSIYSPSIPRVI
jgi:hypothetical protein